MHYMEQEKREKFLKMVEEYKKQIEIEKREHPEKFIPKWPYELYGIECREGWKSLYQPILDRVNEYNDKNESEPIEIHQVKEKYGGLRIYLSKYTDELRQMINDAEEKSYKTCEVCGKAINKPIVKNNWIYTECEECYNKWKKDIKDSENCKDKS